MSLRVLKFGLLTITIIAVAAIGPFLPSKWMTTLIYAQLFAIYAMGWDILSGMTGQISFGHVFFVAVSGYTTGLLNLYLKWPIWTTIPLGVVLAMLAGLLLSVPALRLRGPYFSLVTLILPLAAARLVIILADWTGGELGKFGVAPLCPINDFKLNQYCNYYAVWALMALVGIGLIWLSNSRIGKILEAIRENEEAVEAAGINTAKYKILAFAVSAFAVGLGGAFSVHANEAVFFNSLLSLTTSTEMIVASVVGGMGTIIGALWGGFLVRGGEQMIREIAQLKLPIGVEGFALSFLEKWATFLFFTILIILLFFARQGLLPLLAGLFRKRPATRVSSEEGG